MAVVVFDSEAFKNRYRDFAAVDGELLTAMFAEAEMHCDNTNSSLITDTARRSLILNAIVAHIYELSTTPLVGRIGALSSFGISSTTFYAPPQSGTQAWFDQTPYGASAWAMMAPYRTAFYVAPE